MAPLWKLFFKNHGLSSTWTATTVFSQRPGPPLEVRSPSAPFVSLPLDPSSNPFCRENATLHGSGGHRSARRCPRGPRVSQLREKMFSDSPPRAGARHHLALSSAGRTFPSSSRWLVQVRRSPTHSLPRARNSPPIRGATKSWICWKKRMCGTRQMEPLPRQRKVTNPLLPAGGRGELAPGLSSRSEPLVCSLALSPRGYPPP